MVVACCGYEWLRVVSEWCDALVRGLTIQVLLAVLVWCCAVATHALEWGWTMLDGSER